MRKTAILHYGDTLPSATEFEEGDMFFLRSAGELYIRTGGTWVLSASSSMITSVLNDGYGTSLVSDSGTSNTAKVRSLTTTGNGVTISASTSGGEVELNFDKVAAGWGAANGFATLDSNGFIKEFPSVASIDALRASSGIGSHVVYVRGYYSDGDGGEGIFYYDASDSTSLDNSGTIVVDADGKRWKRIARGVIKAEWFGAFSDGVDRTAEFIAAVGAARECGCTLELQPGTLKISNSTTIELGGISKIAGNTVIDVSSSVAVPIFNVTGSRMQIASGIALTEGQESFTVNTGLNIKRGDTIVITSIEPSPNPARTYYYKGSRVTAESYDQATGALVVYPGVDFSYTSAYVWLISEKHLVIDSGITISGLEGGSQRGIEAKYARLDFHGTIKHIGEKGLGYITSCGIVTGKIADSVFSGTGTSYGIVVMDLSDVHINGATVLAARHAVAAGGGTWNVLDSGGTTSGAASYPSRYTINGGHYASNGSVAGSYALDAHGIVASIAINGAIIDGGISTAARESVISNCVINITPSSYGALYVSSDATSTEWGRLVFAGNSIIGSGSTPGACAIRVGGTMQSAKFNNNFIDVDYGGDTSTSYSTPVYLGGIQTLDFSNNTVNAKNVAISSVIKVSGSASVVGNMFSGQQVAILAEANNIRLRVQGNDVSNSYGYGMYIWGYGYTGHEVSVIGNTAYNNMYAGIYLYSIDVAHVSANRCFDNGIDTGVTSSARAGIRTVNVGKLHVVGNDCSTSSPTQLYGMSLYANTSVVTTDVMLIGNKTHGNATSDYYISGCNILSRVGNSGSGVINDYVLASDGNLYQFDGTSWTAV